MMQIKVERLADTRYRVSVAEGRTATVHEVTLEEADLTRYGAGVSPEHLIEASFRFLLEREPKESILRTFALPVIERYFPEYPSEIRLRL